MKDSPLLCLLYFFVGCLVFSPLIVLCTMQLMHFPFMLPELFVIPILFYCRKKIDWRFDIKTLQIQLILFFILFAISLLLMNFSAVAICSTARGYFYLLLSYAYFKNRKEKSLDWLLFLSLGSVLGWIIVSIYNFSLLNSNSFLSRSAITGNMIALILVISISIIYNYRKVLIVSFVFLIILSVFSGVRRQVLFTILSFLLSFILVVTKKKKVEYLFILGLLVIIVYFLFPILTSFLEETSPVLFRRMIVKNEFLSGGEISSSDSFRYEMISEFWAYASLNIFPGGFVTKRSLDNDVFIDFPIYELTYMLGVFLLFFFLLCYISRFFFHLKNYYIYGVRESGVCLILIVLMFCMLFVEGTFLNYPFVTPFTGFVLARIFSTNNLSC